MKYTSIKVGWPRKMREYAINSEVKKETLKLMLQKFKNGNKRLLWTVSWITSEKKYTVYKEWIMK